MKRLILSADSSAAGGLLGTGLADLVLPLEPHFAGGLLRQPADFAAFFATRSAEHEWPNAHWLNSGNPHYIKRNGIEDFSLIDVCERYEAIDLWIDPDPIAQLTLIGLLDYLRPHEKIVSKLSLLQAGFRISARLPKLLVKWPPPAVKISQKHMKAAEDAWRAYCAPTPQDWFGLLSKDLSILPQLRQTVQELLEELPMPATGLGATEMRMLQLASKRRVGPYELFPGYLKPNKRRVFNYWDTGALLDGLARCQVPALSGLNEGPFTLEMIEVRDRRERYRRSRLSITKLGKAVLVQTEDFSRHNPIDRWWGGTHLTSDNLWRWDPASQVVLSP